MCNGYAMVCILVYCLIVNGLSIHMPYSFTVSFILTDYVNINFGAVQVYVNIYFGAVEVCINPCLYSLWFTVVSINLSFIFYFLFFRLNVYAGANFKMKNIETSLDCSEGQFISVFMEIWCKCVLKLCWIIKLNFMSLFLKLSTLLYQNWW